MASCLFLSVRDHWHEFSMATRIRYSAGAFVYMPGKRRTRTSGFKLSSSRAPLLAPSPLRTGLEGFPFIRLEHPKTPP